jgi:hypothetical protein
MPINVTLHFPKNPELTSDLLRCPGLTKVDSFTIPTEREYYDYTKPVKGMENLCLSVKSLAIEQTIYGDMLRSVPGLDEFLEEFKEESIFLPEDLKHEREDFMEELKKNPDSIIGKWRFNFVRWIKALASEYETLMKINYEHERGDNLYETAYWLFQYIPKSVVVESFGITDCEGNPRWRSSVSKLNNGEIIKSYEEI